MQWQILFSLAPKLLWMVTAATELKETCSLEGKLINLDSVLKSRNITLLTKVHNNQSYGFSSSHVWMWELDNKKGLSNWRMDAFKLWCWRRLLRVPWTTGRSNQSILKKINPEYSLEGLLLKLKLQYFGHLIQKTNSLEKTLMLGKVEGKNDGGNRGWDG